MDLFLAFLTFGTLLAVCLFAFLSGERARARRHDPDAPCSTLAADTDSRGKPADV